MDAFAEAASGSNPLAGIANPFVAHVARDAWDDSEQDVPEINARALELCLHAFDSVAVQRRAASVVLFGEPGSGKTHLLNRLRRLTSKPGQWFVYIQPVAGPDRMFRHILSALARDILSATPGGGSLSQLEAVLAQRLAALQMPSAVAALPGRGSDPLAWWQDVRQLYGRPEQMSDLLEQPLEELAEDLGLSGDLARVLARYLARQHRLDVRGWLEGRGIAEAALERLGVGESLDDEDRARDAILQLSRLAGPDHRAILAFDQLENLVGTAGEGANLKAWGRAVATLFDRCSNVLLVCCAQSQFKVELKRSLPAQDYIRIVQHESSLEPLTRVQATRLAIARLDSDPALAALRRQEAGEPLWPLGARELDRFFESSSRPAREVLAYCRELFDARQRGALPPGPPRPPNRAEDWPALWAQAWDAERARTADPTASVLDEGEVINAFGDLLDVAPRAGVRVEPPTAGLKDVGLILVREGPAGAWRIAVSACQTEQMTSLAHRLRRLLEQRDEGRFDDVLVIRDARLRTGEPNSQTARRFELLAAKGTPALRLEPEVTAALAALRTLLRQARAGDLSVRGHTIDGTLLQEWFRAGLPSELAAASKALFGLRQDAESEQDPEADALAERLVELLGTFYVESIHAAAQCLDVEEDRLLVAARLRSDRIACLNGPPETFFLRPERIPNGMEGGF